MPARNRFTQRLLGAVTVTALVFGTTVAAAAGAGASPVSTTPTAPTTTTTTPSIQSPVPAFAPLAGLNVPGTHAVVAKGYNLGDSVYAAPGIYDADGAPGRVDLAGEVYYPKDLNNGPYPLVVLEAGMHYTCYTDGGDAYTSWPCAAGDHSIPSYLGYAGLGTLLASRGYVVASISPNGVNAYDFTGVASTARATLITESIDLFMDWSRPATTHPVSGQTARPFGDLFLHAIDFSRVATMGHSRSGGAVVLQASQWQAAQKLYPIPASQSYTLRAVLSVAPTGSTSITGIPYGVIVPSCDGDIVNQDGVNFYDDSRYALPGDQAPKSLVVIDGANHNFFNTIWSPQAGYPGSRDDSDPDYTGYSCESGSPARLTESQQRLVGYDYMSAFFRLYLGGETRLAPLWNGTNTDAAQPFPHGVQVSYQGPASQRTDINTYASAHAENTDSTGGKVTYTDGLTHAYCDQGDCSDCYAGGIIREITECGTFLEPSFALGMVTLAWSQPGEQVTEALKGATQDLTGDADLRLRLTVDRSPSLSPDWTEPDNFSALDFSIKVTDTAGRTSSVLASSVDRNGVLAAPRQGRPDERLATEFLLSDLVVPTTKFTGVDLGHVAAVSLVFNKTPSGRIGLAGITADHYGPRTASSTTVPAPQQVQYGTAATVAVAVTQTGQPVLGGTLVLNDGTGTLTAPITGAITAVKLPATLPVGTHTVTAQFTGTATIAPSTTTTQITVVKAHTTATLTVPTTPKPSTTLTSTVNITSNSTGTPPTGTVTFYIDGFPTDPITIKNGTATTGPLPSTPGQHLIRVNYTGDTNYQPSSGINTYQIT